MPMVEQVSASDWRPIRIRRIVQELLSRVLVAANLWSVIKGINFTRSGR
jgi:hypothetical protein